MPGELPGEPSTRVALVTGVAGPLGRAVAALLAERGWRLALADRDVAAAAACAAALPGGARALPHDPEATPAARLIAAAAELGPLRLLVPAARGAVPDDFGGLDGAAWATNLERHLHGPARLLDAFAASLGHGCPGDVVLAADGRIEARSRGFLSYGLAMRGVETLVRAAATALAPHVRVNAVGPSEAAGRRIATDDALAPSEALAARLAAAVPFVLEAPAMTGQVLLLHDRQPATATRPADQR